MEGIEKKNNKLPTMDEIVEETSKDLRAGKFIPLKDFLSQFKE